MTRTQWNAIACAYRLPTTTLHRYIHTCMHACMCRDDDFLSPTECADEHLPVVVLVVVVVVRLTTE